MNTLGTSESASWEVEALRLTVFPVEPHYSRVREWWDLVVVEPPTEIVDHPRENNVSYRLVDGSVMTMLQVQPGRIDWHLQSSRLTQPELGEAIELPTIGPFGQIVQRFSDLCLRWLDLAPTYHRLAFGARLLAPTPSRDSGYELLQRFLTSVVIDVQGSSDFLYRINRPREISVDSNNFSVNRLSTWAVQKYRAVITQLSFEEPKDTVALFTSPEIYAGRLELDINTNADTDISAVGERGGEIFSKFVDMAEELATKGDV